MDVLHQEDALPQPGQQIGHFAGIEPPALLRGDPLQSLEDPLLILFGLQSSDEPGARIGEPLVIKIDGILRGEHDP